MSPRCILGNVLFYPIHYDALLRTYALFTVIDKHRNQIEVVAVETEVFACPASIATGPCGIRHVVSMEVMACGCIVMATVV